MSETTPITIKDLKKLIAQNELEEAIKQLLQFNENRGNDDIHNLIIIQSGKFEQYQKESLLGTVDYDSLTRTRVNISLALINIIAKFPKEEVVSVKEKKRITEGQYRTHLLLLLFLGKIFFFAYIFTIWESGGLPYSGFVGTLSIVLPVFATYLALAWDNLLSDKNKHTYSQKLTINRKVQYAGYLALAVYYFALFLVLGLQAAGTIPDDPIILEETEIPTFKNFFGLLALVEASIGVYVHKLIFSFFKKEA